MSVFVFNSTLWFGSTMVETDGINKGLNRCYEFGSNGKTFSHYHKDSFSKTKVEKKHYEISKDVAGYLALVGISNQELYDWLYDNKSFFCMELEDVGFLLEYKKKKSGTLC
jgi:hypothetical protein